MGSYNEPYKEGRPIKSAKGADVAKSVLGEVKKASDRTSLTDSGVLRKGSFKLRNGAGKMDSYSAMQKKGLISPMHVEDPPKKKGRMITELSNTEIYKLDKKGYFEKNPSEMKRLMNTPTSSGSSTVGKQYEIWSGGRDKEIAERMKVGQLGDKNKDLIQWQKDHINAPDKVKDYGPDDWKKKQSQKAGKVYDDKGERVYAGQEKHTKGYLDQKSEGLGVPKDVLVKRL